MFYAVILNFWSNISDFSEKIYIILYILFSFTHEF